MNKSEVIKYLQKHLPDDKRKYDIDDDLEESRVLYIVIDYEED